MESLYKASLSNVEFKNSGDKFDSCILTISVGQTVHEAEKFKSTLKLVSRSFKKCTIGICDTLQRHTMAILAGVEEGEALYEVAKKEGDQWIDRNIEYCENYLSIPFEMKRWDSWFHDKRYLDYREKVNALYKTDQKFIDIVKDLAIDFNSRLKKRGYALDEERGIRLSTEYLLEECAAMSIWYEDGYSVDLYPSIRNNAIEYSFSVIMSEYYNRLLLPGGINFKKNNSQNAFVSEMAVQKILDMIPGHVYWKDTNGKFVGCNKRQADNYGFKSVNGLIGKQDKDFLREDIAKEIETNDRQIIDSKQEQLLEEKTYMQVSKKWVQKWVLSHKTPLLNEAGDVIGIVGLSIDISKQKKLEQSLLKETKKLSLSLEHKTNFLNMLSHEIRTPLHITNCIVEELSQNVFNLSEKEVNKLLVTLSENSKRLIKLLTHLLDSASNAKGQITYNMMEGNIVDTCKACIKEFSYLLPDISLNINDKQKIILRYDEVKISQVIRNILENAMKYGSKNSIAVKIEEMINPKAVMIKIENAGSHFLEHEKERLFNNFFQGENARNKQDGIGLGLSICKEIVEMHEGKIWVENIGIQRVSVNFFIPYK